MSAVSKPKIRKQRRRFAKHRDYEYQTWIRRQACIAWLQVPAVGYGPQHEGRMHCAHVRSRGAGGDDHGNCVPLCARHHNEQHLIGVHSFELRYGLDLKAEAEKLWRAYQDAVPPFQETDL